MAPADRLLPPLRPWNVASLALLVLYLASVALFSYAALVATSNPGAESLRWPLVRSYADPGAWWPVAVQVLLGGFAFWTYYYPRRHETRSFSLLVTGGLAVTTIWLGVSSTWNCGAGESPFFAPLTKALGLILGNGPELNAPCDAAAPPLALQVAQLFALLLVVIAALGIVATLFRAQLDRLSVRWSGSLVVVVGLSEEAVPLLRRLSADLGRSTTLAVLVEDAANPLVRLTRNLGARVVVCDFDRAGSIRALLIRQSRFKVDALYLVSADVSANLAWAGRIQDIAVSSRTLSTDEPPMITTRIDDPWQAEYWRRTNAYRTPPGGSVQAVRWVSDALSVYEVTATTLVAHLQAAPHDRLIVVGNSALALAICAELAQREREGAVLHQQPVPSFAQLVLVGTDAEALRQQHQIRQERFGNSAELNMIEVVEAEPTEPKLAELLDGHGSPAVIFADDLEGRRSRDLSVTLLAAMHPQWTIYHSDAATSGLASEPIMERLFPFGLTIEPPEGAAVNSWERAARVVHANYLKSLGEHLDESKAAHHPWQELPTFYRESNIRLITATLAGAESVQRTWGPEPDGSSLESTTSVEPDQLLTMAMFEHRSWKQFYEDNGWKYGPERNDARRIHNALVPWEALSPDYRQRTVNNVTDALSTLRALGYRSWAVTSRPWIRYARRGEVTVARQHQAWSWTTDSGDVLHARAGDYRVSDGSGTSWSVEAVKFVESYEHVAGDRWRRTGTVLAQPAVAGELVISLEGPELAKSGDWVIKGDGGVQWVISGGHFKQNYTPVAA